MESISELSLVEGEHTDCLRDLEVPPPASRRVRHAQWDASCEFSSCCSRASLKDIEYMTHDNYA